jgi:hypothetical protein
MLPQCIGKFTALEKIVPETIGAQQQSTVLG